MVLEFAVYIFHILADQRGSRVTKQQGPLVCG